jgi:hypothetical protein
MTDPVFPWRVLSKDDAWQQRTFLFYGPSGVGKTKLASQFPSPLFLSCDPGILGGAASAHEGVKQMKVSNYEQLMSLIPTLQQYAGTEFKTLVVDSVTYMGKLSMAHILKSVGREMPRFDEFNLNYQRVARLINNLSELNCHIIFTAIDKIDKNEVTGQMFGGPDLVGKLSKELPQAVDVVCRLFTTTGYDTSGKLKVSYKLKTVPDDIFIAKDRLSLLPAECASDFAPFKPFFKDDELTA